MSDLITGDQSIFLVREVAAMFRVSVMAVYRLIEVGELRAVKVGGSFRIPRADLERYLREHMTAAVPA